MTSITYIRMDVHTTNYTLCCYTVEDDKTFANVQVRPEYTEIFKYINRIRKQPDFRFLDRGYHAQKSASRMLRTAYRGFVLDPDSCA